MATKLKIPEKRDTKKCGTGCRSFRLGDEILKRMEQYRSVNWSEFVRNQIAAAIDQLDAEKAGK